VEEAGDEEEDPTTCSVCRRRDPEHNMLLCDGCDAPYHTDCLAPALPGIPTGSWLCPGCDAQVEGAGMSRRQATRYRPGGAAAAMAAAATAVAACWLPAGYLLATCCRRCCCCPLATCC
jgi:hypothetical protein